MVRARPTRRRRMAAGAHKADILDVLSDSLTYGVKETINSITITGSFEQKGEDVTRQDHLDGYIRKVRVAPQMWRIRLPVPQL